MKKNRMAPAVSVRNLKVVLNRALMLVFVSAAVSCENNPEAPEPDLLGGVQKLLYATTETLCNPETGSGVITKTALSGSDAEGYDLVWSAGDEITLCGHGINIYQLYSGAGSTSATFYKESDGTLADGEYDAYYRMISNSLPATQKYDAGTVKNSPMHATVSVTGGEPGPVQFHNLCGLLRLTVKKKHAISLKSITVSADQALCGSFDIVDYAAVMTSSSKQVTLKCDAAVALSYEGTDFYIALPQNSYSNVVITFTDVDGSVCTKRLKAGKTLDIERSKITPAKMTLEKLDFIPSRLVAVDMGLPSGTKWANLNMGAVEADKSGDYFAWGETSFKNYYSWGTLEDNPSGDRTTFVKYNHGEGGKTELDPEDDVAYVRWGGNWRTPTLEQFEELIDSEYTTWTWVGMTPQTDSQGDRCDVGYMVESKTNGNRIFLPLTGQYIGDELVVVVDQGCYWSATLMPDEDHGACHLYITPEMYKTSNTARMIGECIRPVWK